MNASENENAEEEKNINIVVEEDNIKNLKSDIKNKHIDNKVINNNCEALIGSNELQQNYDQIISEFLLGNWQSFFNSWNISFPLNIKESIEYQILTLKLRIHFAILPIRIIQLQQHETYVTDESNHVSVIFRNAAKKFKLQDYEKDIEDEQNTLTTASMKQLEIFLNSFAGQQLTVQLKDTPFMKFFALPYIFSPQDDEAMKNIFSIIWLEELTSELKKFVTQFYPEKNIITNSNLIDSEQNSFYNKKKSVPQIQTVSFSKSKLTPSSNNVLHDQFMCLEIDNKITDDWLAQHCSQDNEQCTKSTQTHISSIRNGTAFSVISEFQHNSSIVKPCTLRSIKQSAFHSDELKLTKLHLFNIHKNYRKLKLKFHKLHEDYQKMNEIAEKLTIALENSIRGQSINLDMILQSCMKIFPNRFNKDIHTDSEDTCSYLKEDLPKNTFYIEEKSKIVNCFPLSHKLLDFNKIKFHLLNGNIKTKLLLLQALRQKLTLCEPELRKEVIFEYINNDLLGIQDNLFDCNKNNILSYLLQPSNFNLSVNIIQQTTTRLLNALASLSCGRIYLTSGPIILNTIIRYLDYCNNGDSDAISLDMILATLQKMSLRKEQRIYMIEANIVEWLIHHLSNETFKIGLYRLEYACALIMNLSLQSKAWSRASIIAPLFISTMIHLLSTDCESIMPYVNGALQNFLLNNEINEEAKKLHLAEVLEYCYIKSNKEYRQQFYFTLKIHKRDYQENIPNIDEILNEDDEIFDNLENELEENDPIKDQIGELQGESLLITNYLVPNYLLKLENFCKNKVVEVSTGQKENLLLRESKTVTSNTSKMIINETVLDDFKTEISEKNNDMKVNCLSQKLTSRKKEEEDAFLAKPKLMRTPPVSARPEVNEEEKSNQIK